MHHKQKLLAQISYLNGISCKKIQNTNCVRPFISSVMHDYNHAKDILQSNVLSMDYILKKQKEKIFKLIASSTLEATNKSTQQWQSRLQEANNKSDEQIHKLNQEKILINSRLKVLSMSFAEKENELKKFRKKELLYEMMQQEAHNQKDEFSNKRKLNENLIN